jgi:hypothetical protein
MMTEFYYRYYDGNSYGEISINLEKFRVKRRTSKGVWIEVGMYPVKEKFILYNARVRYAYPTKELAEQSFRIRKEKQYGYIREALRRNMLVRKRLKQMPIIEDVPVMVKAAPKGIWSDWK